ncbi:Hypothetical protein I595_2538 [Croceitalea dokdonensis DOKDO 023]|uniref:Transposase n=1 Tax=Croceitalea dokdonensis DOKDO 023 TaxID=1300341 RepID=A0A0P7ADH8_9FLAO|nr:Hypothetical protein I595_2538 [Croceitalea dokdonensis DOKDO 023]
MIKALANTAVLAQHFYGVVRKISRTSLTYFVLRLKLKLIIKPAKVAYPCPKRQQNG